MQTGLPCFHTAFVNCPAKGRTAKPVEFAPMFVLIIPPWLNIASFWPCHVPDINSCAKETLAEITKLGVLDLWFNYSQDGKSKLVIIFAGLKLPWLQDARPPFLPHCPKAPVCPVPTAPDQAKGSDPRPGWVVSAIPSYRKSMKYAGGVWKLQLNPYEFLSHGLSYPISLSNWPPLPPFPSSTPPPP